jgi:hypothetical protein
MRSRPLLALALVLMMLAGGTAVPSGVPSALADPVKPTQVHITTFADGSEEVTGEGGIGSHLVAEVSVPAGAGVISATVNVSRLRFETAEMALEDSPRDIWCGNIDKDGYDDDLLVTYPKEGRVDVYTVSRTPARLVLRTSLAVPGATSVAVDDLDRDNDRDILVTSSSTGRLYVFENLALDTFAEPLVIPVGPRPGDLAVSDLDPDFRRDVVVANSGGSSVSTLHGRGDLRFYPRLDEMGPGPAAVQLRDMDKDLDPDLVVVESRNDTVTVLYNEGNGNFSNATSMATGVGPVGLDVGDLNGDSYLDIAVACSGSNEVWVYGGGPEGDFELIELLPVGKAPRAVMGFQANKLSDPNEDVVAACSGSDNLTVYLAGGNLMHTIPVDVPVGGRPVAMHDLRANKTEPETIMVACQWPPSIVMVKPVRVAEVVKLGLGMDGKEGTVQMPLDAEATVMNVTEAMGNYVSDHHGEARLGMLTVRLDAWGDHSPGLLRLSDLDVWVHPNRPPRADAGRNVTVLVGEAATLNGSASYDPDGDPLEFLWLLPGMSDASHTDMVSQHVWTEPGTYPILLVAMDRWGLADQDQVFVVVNAPPVAKGVVPSTVNAREPVRLSAHLSEDPDGTIVDYVWDHGQGLVHGRSVDVIFTGTGDVNVTLMVIDDMDARSTATYKVEVLEAKTPLREPAELTPDDRGEVPGYGAVVSALALLGAAAAVARRHHR